MSNKGGSTRWWEWYLVRYFVPSIAGMVIVLWLSSIAGSDFRRLLMIPEAISRLESSRLLLLFLYGNLYCYIASYPILVFHATRVLDFRYYKWPKHYWSDPYIWSIFIGVFTFLLSKFISGKMAFYLAYLLVAFFSEIQLARLIYVMRKIDRRNDRHNNIYSTRLNYDFTYKLADQRSSRHENSAQKNWRGEFVETYRHMREHGNSAFIFFLEIILSGVVYCIVAIPGNTAVYKLSAVGVLFAIWAAPSVFVHLFSQHLERQFSKYFQQEELHPQQNTK